MEIKKAIILTAGLGTRFLPLSKVLAKELFPLVDIPILQYIVNEAIDSGIKEIIFVNRPENKQVLEYFKDNENLERILKKRGKKQSLNELEKLRDSLKNISFFQTFQKEPLGSTQAVLKAKKFVKNEISAILYSDDVVESKTPCLSQLIKVFKKYQKPVIALYRIPKESIPFYGMVEVKKVSKRLYKIKRVAEKPSIKESPSNLAIVGKYIITPEFFNYLKENFSKKISLNLKTDISLSIPFGEWAENGEEVYGYEFEGKWMECGNKLAYLKSNLYLSLKHPQFGKELKKFLRKI